MEVKKGIHMFSLQPEAMMSLQNQSEKPTSYCQLKEGTFLSKQTSPFIIQGKMVLYDYSLSSFIYFSSYYNLLLLKAQYVKNIQKKKKD